MANIIDIVVGKQAQAEVDKLIASLKLTHEEIIKINQQGLKINSGTSPKNPVQMNQSVNETIALNEKLEVTTKKLTDTEKKLQQERVKELQLQKQREDAVDKYNAQLEKSYQKQINESNKIIAQKEKEFAKFEKQFNEYEADLAKQVIAEQNAKKKQVQAILDQSKAIQSLQNQKEKEFAKFEKQFNEYEADLAKQVIAEQNARKKQVQAILDQSKAIQSLQNQKEKELNLLAKEEAKLANASNAYNKLQAELSKLQFAYQNLAVRKEQGATLTKAEAQQYDYLKNRIQQHDKTLKAVDATMGKYQRNVGNYASAFNPLQNSINQLGREMPAFANSVKTGFMAISNNLPAFFDAMGDIIAQNKELQKQGKPTESVFDKLGESLFSLQTLLSVGVTLLTLYGEEIVNAFSGSSTAIENFKKNMLDVNGTVTEQAVKLEVVKQVLNDTKSTQLQYNEALRIAKENGISLNAVEQARKGNLELINDELDKNIKISIKKAQADMLIGLIAEQEINNYKDRKKAGEDYFSWYRKLARNISVVGGTSLGLSFDIKELQNLKDGEKAVVDYTDELKKLLAFIDIEEPSSKKALKTKEITDLKLADADYLASRFATEKRILEINIEANKKTLENDNLTSKEREEAEKNYFSNKNRLIQLSYQEEIRLQQKTYSEELLNIKTAYLEQLKEVGNSKKGRIQAEIEKNKAIQSLTKDNANKLNLIEVNHNNDILQLTEEQIDSIVAIREKLTEKTAQENLISSDTLSKLKALIELRKQLNNSNSQNDFTDLEKQKTKILSEESLKRLEIEKTEIEEKLSNFDKYKKGSLERENIEKQYLDVKKKIFEETSKIDEELIKEAEALNKLLEDTYKGFIDDFGSSSGFGKMIDIFSGGLKKFKGDAKATALVVSEAFQEAFNTISESSQRNFEAEYSRLEQQKNISLQFAGESTTAKEEIERQYEEKRKAIARREAEAQKRLAVFNIAINTAQAIVGLWAKPGFPKAIPLAIAVGALGAAQIAMVSSKEIPQFWKGTENAPEGLAWTQEKGAEVITDKKGNVKTLGNNKGAQLTYLEKGDKVYKSHQDYINKTLVGAGIQPMRENNSLTSSDFNNGISKLAKTMQSNKGSNTQVFFNNKQIDTNSLRGIGKKV